MRSLVFYTLCPDQIPCRYLSDITKFALYYLLSVCPVGKNLCKYSEKAIWKPEKKRKGLSIKRSCLQSNSSCLRILYYFAGAEPQPLSLRLSRVFCHIHMLYRACASVLIQEDARAAYGAPGLPVRSLHGKISSHILQADEIGRAHV